MQSGATNINVWVDPRLKQDAENLFADLGLSMSSAISLFLQAAVSHDGIPFEIKLRLPNPNTRAAMAEYSAMQDHPDQYKRHCSVDEVIDEALDDILRTGSLPQDQQASVESQLKALLGKGD